jgi:exopolyphosphatase / guanosine-5'-triphosphate,3'-diphosphate pyrophosphatase
MSGGDDLRAVAEAGNRVAAVDVGTNSVRLLVAAPATRAATPGATRGADTPGGLDRVERIMRITRLGKGVDATGHLDDEALADTLAVIADYARCWIDLGADRVRIAATSAVRDAEDRERFFAGVRERAGVDAEVLTGEQEAATAFRGATATVEAEPPYVVLDIGGGSTELIRGEDRPHAWTSRQLGCVRLTERSLAGDPPTAEEVAAAREVAAAELDAVEEIVDPAAARTLIAVAGTATTLAALHLGLDDYLPDAIHGTRMPLEAVTALTAQLTALTAQERAALGPMAPGREDVIVGGALILQGVMERFGFDEVLVSEADILDGLALSLLDRG